MTRVMSNILMSVLLLLWVASEGQPLLRIPNVRYIFDLSASPTGEYLLLFVSEDAPDGEFMYGVATLLRLDGARIRLAKKLPALRTLSDTAPPVWAANGQFAFYLTEEGVFQVAAASSKVRPLAAGSPRGLALSSDERHLAFWDSSQSEISGLRLSLFDVHTRQVVRHWTVPTNYAADQFGHEVAFAIDGKSILARTYELEDRTPLKEFRLDAQLVQTIWPDCLALAAARGGVYFIAQEREKRSLMMIADTTQAPKRIIERFEFDSLVPTASRNSLIAYDSKTRQFAILDIESARLFPIRQQVDAVTVLPNGKLVCAKGDSVFHCTPAKVLASEALRD
jgi:hypothetical protein